MIKKALSIDDDPVLSMLLRELFERYVAGYELYCESHAVRAIQLLQSHHDSDEGIGVVLLDISMPDVDGFMLGNYIHKRFPEISIVFVTAHATVENMERAFHAHFAYDFIAKPIDVSALVSVVQTAYDKYMERRKIDGLHYENTMLRDTLKLTFEFYTNITS